MSKQMSDILTKILVVVLFKTSVTVI